MQNKSLIALTILALGIATQAAYGMQKNTRENIFVHASYPQWVVNKVKAGNNTIDAMKTKILRLSSRKNLSSEQKARKEKYEKAVEKPLKVIVSTIPTKNFFDFLELIDSEDSHYWIKPTAENLMGRIKSGDMLAQAIAHMIVNDELVEQSPELQQALLPLFPKRKIRKQINMIGEEKDNIKKNTGKELLQEIEEVTKEVEALKLELQ